MRTSRASKETSKVLQALSPPARRQTRSAALTTSALKSFAYNGDSTLTPESIPTIARIPTLKSDDESSLSSANTADIEDLVDDLEPSAKRRKRNASSKVLSVSNRSSRKPLVKEDPDTKSAPPAKARRMPARKTRDADGAVVVEPPSNWETMYNIVKKMREDNPTAPVDTMGCAELYWRASSPRDRRFQTLVALMLSSQTKDTVTAVAMQRLHTELGDDQLQSDCASDIKPEHEQPECISDIRIKAEEDDSKALQDKDSTLNLENILAVSPTRLNSLIEKVGFHNNKTKYIKAAALILRDQYNGDIPATPEGLMKLPGVGPKMAYLCMSAAWGKHEGIGVDVHVHRITNLWGWHKTKTPEETRMALQSWLPRDKWHEINKLLVGLGQTACQPVKRRCGECYLAGTKLCKSEVKGLTPVKREIGVKTSPELDEPKIKIETS
ncbi:DNA polymerase alpha-associated DNA helicase A [Penicillium macrosclerotiorum]|uniref:DNA polymerase alpha-associated DNA helicase A n=1 Tax=Penicillium macrosclerotiorum TaxID=303699 RepID=UPI002549684A|nr:DNA polymerase alpha-associated DNA helicase A [Penicillium macrosclerotiorum]KAJ5683507.1 DNA polymerase alpha-associated DNA helicase A [Penicillium macrosclerotiorum]